MKTTTVQQWNPDEYADNARFVSDLGMPVVELLSPKLTETILDLGCGDGALTQSIAKMAHQVVAVDSSGEMVKAAQKLGINASVMNGETLSFDNQFDAVFSNAALHWMKQPQSVIQSVWNALKNEGRFVGEMGAAGNVFSITNALDKALAVRGLQVESPWFFPSVSHYQSLLAQQGFQITYIEQIIRPTLLPSDVSGWLKTFAKVYITVLPEADRSAFVDDVKETLRPLLCDDKGDWYADYIRLRFSAKKVVSPS